MNDGVRSVKKRPIDTFPDGAPVRGGDLAGRSWASLSFSCQLQVHFYLIHGIFENIWMKQSNTIFNPMILHCEVCAFQTT